MAGIISIQDLGFSYAGGVAALEGVDLEVPAGELLCLAGANGSGKSTLLALMAGLYAPGKGGLCLDGHASPGQEDRIRRSAGLVFQEADLQILGSSPEEDLLLGMGTVTRENEAEKLDQARAMAARFGLEQKLQDPVQSLSYGQKRKLCLAAVLLADPAVILYDEPMSGLDYPAMREMRAILAANKANGLTQVVSAHDLEPVVDLADTLAVLHRGRLVLHGPPGDILDRVAEYDVRPPCSWRAGLGITPWE